MGSPRMRACTFAIEACQSAIRPADLSGRDFLGFVSGSRHKTPGESRNLRGQAYESLCNTLRSKQVAVRSVLADSAGGSTFDLPHDQIDVEECHSHQWLIPVMSRIRIRSLRVCPRVVEFRTFSRSVGHDRMGRSELPLFDRIASD